MRKKETSPKETNSNTNFSRRKKPFISLKENKFKLVSNLFNASNESIIINTNNDIYDNDEINDEVNDINEENIYDNSGADQIIISPINESHRMSSSKNRFGKTFINCISLKKISVPRSKSPNIIRHIKTRNRNVFKNASDTLTKSIQRKKEIFSINSDFLHCRNCMLIIALNRYGKFYFNK